MHTKIEREREMRWGLGHEKETERGRTVKTTSGIRNQKVSKQDFADTVSQIPFLVSAKSKIRIQRRFSFYFFPEIRRKEHEAAFNISTKKKPFPGTLDIRPFFLGNFQLISYPVVFNYVCCQFRDFIEIRETT